MSEVLRAYLFHNFEMNYYMLVHASSLEESIQLAVENFIEQEEGGTADIETRKEWEKEVRESYRFHALLQTKGDIHTRYYL